MKFLVCRRVGDSTYTIVDTHVDCSSEYYNNNILPVNLASLILLLVVIPGFMFYKIN